MSKYECPVCGKLRQPDRSQFEVGQLVSFSVSRAVSRNNIRMTMKEGKVVGIKGDIVTVKVPRMGIIKAHRSRLNPGDAPGPLTYALKGSCMCTEVAQ